MKVTSLAVITLLLLGCSFASAQTLRLVSSDGSLDCGYVLTQLTPYDVWEGYSEPCGGLASSTIVGISGGLSKAGNPGAFPVKGVVFADNAYDAFSGTFTGAQLFIATNLKCSSKKYGWISFAGMSGLVFGVDMGYVSCNSRMEAGRKQLPVISHSKAPARK